MTIAYLPESSADFAGIDTIQENGVVFRTKAVLRDITYTITRRNMTTNRLFSWIIAEVFFILSVVIAMLFAILSDQIARSLKLDPSQLGFLGGIYFIAYAAGQLGFGVVLRLSSPRIILTSTAALSAIGSCLFAASDSFGTAVLARILMGTGLSSTFVGVIYLVGKNYAGKFAFMSSLSQSLATIITAAVAILSASIPFLADFRLPFMILAVLLLLNAIFIFVFLEKTGAESSTFRANQTFGASLITALNSLQFWVALIYYAGLFGSFLAFVDLWNIRFQMNFFNHNIETSSVMNAMIPLGVAIGSLFAGTWAERSGFVLPARVFGLLTVLFFTVMLLVSLPQSAAAGMMFLIGFGFSGSILGLTSIQQNLPVATVPLATSLVVTSAFIFSGIIQPIIGVAISSPQPATIWLSFLNNAVPDFGVYQHGIMPLLLSVATATIGSFFFKEKQPR